MATSFSVTSSQHILELDSQGQGEAVVTVSNLTDRPKRAQLKVYVQGEANKSWFTLEGEQAREFTANGTQQVSIAVKVPEGTQPGSYTFRLHAISTNDPDRDYAEGPWITMNVEEVSEEEDTPVPVGLIIGLVIGALVLIGGVVGYVVCCTGDDEPAVEVVMVEDVIGMSIEEATEIIEGQGFVVKEVAETSESPEGEVLDQDPVNSEEPTGTTITLTVAGEETEAGEVAKVKDVRGKAIEEAKDILEGQGFEVKIMATTSDREEGEVLAQDIVNSEEATGTLITLNVAAPAFAEVKDVIGKSYKKAKKILEDKGFVVKKIMEPSDEKPDEVLAQDPGNETAAVGTTVTLTVAVRRSVEVEDVIGKMIEEAKDILEEQGFVVKEVPKASEEKPGEVLAQDPVDTEKPVGTEITLIVAALPSEIKVPDVIDATFEAAKREIEDRGFRLGKVAKILATEDADIVVDQYPRPLTMHARGDKIDIKVNVRGEEVPDLIDMQIQAAMKKIKELPLEMDVAGYAGTKFSDKIKSTEPKAGKIVALQTNIVATPYRPPSNKEKPWWQKARRYQHNDLKSATMSGAVRLRGIEPTEEFTIGELLERATKEKK